MLYKELILFDSVRKNIRILLLNFFLTKRKGI